MEFLIDEQRPAKEITEAFQVYIESYKDLQAKHEHYNVFRVDILVRQGRVLTYNFRVLKDNNGRIELPVYSAIEIEFMDH